MAERNNLHRGLACTSSVPLVSVVILNYNGLRFLGSELRDCVESVVNSNYPNLEVIFVDNGSDDGSSKFIEENFFGVKTVLNRVNLGFSEGFNSGIRLSRGKFIGLLSNDMNVAADWLNPIVELMQSDSRVGLAGFKRLVRGSNRLLDGIGGDLYLCGRVKTVGAGEIDHGQYDADICDLDFIGGAMVVRRKTMSEVGLIDPLFKVFSEDVDLCFRIRRAGYKVVYAHNAVIWHKGQATLKGMDSKGLFLEYISNQNRVRCNIIHFTVSRFLAACLIDTVWFIMANSVSKLLLMKAYLWNLRNIPSTLRKRLAYGPSPPFRCKAPVLPFSILDVKRRMRNLFG